MIIKTYLRPVLLLFVLSWILAGCGGGGGGGATEPPKAFQVTISAQDTTLSASSGEFDHEPGSPFATQINASVTDASGRAAANGTVVTFAVSNAELGAVSPTDDLANKSSSIDVASGGGQASAVFHTKELTGDVRVTATAFDSAANRNVSASVTITIDGAVEPPRRISLEAARTQLPANSFNVPPFYPNSPYISEVTLQFRNSEGVIAEPADAEFGVSISPVLDATFTTLDDPETQENELFVELGNGPVDAAGGEGTVFVNAGDSPGIVTLTVTAQDADTGESFASQLEFEIVEPASNEVPSNVVFSGADTLLYVQGSGGQTAGQLEILVQDGAGEPVPDSVGRNNVLVELLPERPNSGEFLSATNASGTSVSGTSVRVPTTAGITGVTLHAGTEPGLVSIRATADAADNNVNNGIDAPVTGTFEVEISDGIPFAIQLATVPAGPVSPGAQILSANPNAPFPLTSNDVLTMLIEAVVTDRRGNPPARPVTIEFGLIDSPTDGFPSAGPGAFAISGFDGNPEEGGRRFFAPTGEFLTAGGGAGPGDTLTLFGKDVVGNADLEGARTVEQVLDQDTIRVDEPFNLNDTTGMSVNNGNVVPYVIGRALLGNIETADVTDADGVASTFLNWPVSAIGRSLVIYAQGTNGDLGDAGNIRTFGDVVLTAYPGLSPFTLTASPTTIPANTTATVQVCAADGAGVPVPGLNINFFFDNASGSGVIDGQEGSGTLANATGFDGCALASVMTSGFLAGSDGMLTFSAGGGEATVDIVTDAADILQVQPSTIIGDNLLGREVTIRLITSDGDPISGVQIAGVCTSDIGAINFREEPGVTDENGETTAVIIIDGLDGVCPGDAGGSGSCEFSTASGTPSATLTIRGREGDITPSPITCP